MQVHQLDTSALNASIVSDNLGAGQGNATSQFQRVLKEKISPVEQELPIQTGAAMGEKRALASSKWECLGTITAETPTVSHLLYRSSHKSGCWDILAKEINADKPFTRIPSGTRIYMNTQSHEIVWTGASSDITAEGEGKHIFSGKSDVGEGSICTLQGQRALFEKGNTALDPKGTDGKKSEQTPSALASSSRGDTSSSHDLQGLDEAVGAFIGTSYSRMNCYELVVEGLERMGVQYRGTHGLSRHLMNQAALQGRSSYSLHSGEGLSRAIGTEVFKTTFTRVTGTDSQAQSVLKQMSQVLEEGQILSFSTPTHGHTGVISKKDGQWTFINSGVMDHNLAGKNGGKAVGEERLDAELDNWFRRAEKAGSSLTITLGAVDTAKLARFQPRIPTSTVSQRV